MSDDTLKTQSTLKINKGVTITPPAVGRIMMGHTEVRQSKTDGETRALPVKDDHFTITTLVQNPDRTWQRHPIEQAIARDDQPITEIPVRLAYNDPGLTLHNRYTAFGPKGRPLCVGDGDKAKRLTDRGMISIDCPRNHACGFGKENRCKGMSRIYLQIEGQKDGLDVFVLRTTSHNTLAAVGGQLSRLFGYTGGILAGMPLLLRLVTKTSTQSMRTPFYFATLSLRPDMTLAQALAAAKAYQAQLTDAGLNQEGMEEAMRAGLANSDFADELEDMDEWVGDDDIAELAAGNLERQGLKAVDGFISRLKGDAPTDASGVAAPEVTPESPSVAPAADSAPAASLAPAQAASAPESSSPTTSAPAAKKPVRPTSAPAMPRASAPRPPRGTPRLVA